VLIDARHTPQKNDLEFINQLDKWEVPFTLIFTKADKEKPTVVLRNEKLFLDKMRETWQFLPQSFITSAEKKQGREEVLSLIQKLNEKAIQQSK
jgi:GTP-binding protein